MNGADMTKGVIYKASGSKYIREVLRSAKSLKYYNPDLPVTLFTDGDIKDHHYIDEVIEMDDPIRTMGDSLLNISDVMYERTLFLDSDTYVCDNIDDIFYLLDRSDIAVAFSPKRKTNEDISKCTAIPDVFPQYNSGVIALKRNPSIENFLKRWRDLYEEFDLKYNQPAMRRALFESDLEVSILPPEYNFRVRRLGVAHGKVKILHGRPGKDFDQIDRFEEKINSQTSLRVITWGAWPCKVHINSNKNILYVSIDNMHEFNAKRKEYGTLEMLSRAVDFLIKGLRQ